MNDGVTNDLRAYGSTLTRSGGRELQAVPPCSDALAAVLYASPPYALTLPPMSVARLSINLSQAEVVGGLEGERSRVFLARRHSLFLTPAGAGVAWRKTSSTRHINIYFDAATFAEPDDAARGRQLGEASPWWNGGLPGAGAMFDMLAAELAEAQPFSAEAVDSLSRLILLRLARRGVAAPARPNPVTPALQARLTEYTLAHLEHRVLIADLAAVAGLSPNRFAQAYTRATGRSPHQFVLQLRLDRAVQLLRHATQPLADVAAACGFASQQHMTQVMRRRLGTTPARWRAAPGEALPPQQARDDAR